MQLMEPSNMEALGRRPQVQACNPALFSIMGWSPVDCFWIAWNHKPVFLYFASWFVQLLKFKNFLSRQLYGRFALGRVAPHREVSLWGVGSVKCWPSVFLVYTLIEPARKETRIHCVTQLIGAEKDICVAVPQGSFGSPATSHHSNLAKILVKHGDTRSEPVWTCLDPWSLWPEASHFILLCSPFLGTSQGCVCHRLFTVWEGIEQVPLQHVIDVRQDLIRWCSRKRLSNRSIWILNISLCFTIV